MISLNVGLQFKAAFSTAAIITHNISPTKTIPAIYNLAAWIMKLVLITFGPPGRDSGPGLKAEWTQTCLARLM